MSFVRNTLFTLPLLEIYSLESHTFGDLFFDMEGDALHTLKQVVCVKG